MANRKSGMKKSKSNKWIKSAIRHPGAFTRWCKSRGYKGVTQACINEGKKSSSRTVRKQAVLAQTLRRLPRHHGPR